MQKVRKPPGKEMRDYLLGKLTDDDRAEVEGRLLGDDQFFEELLISENELVDEYFAGRLTEGEKHRFETHFLIGPERQAKFRFGRVFNQYLELRDSDDPASEKSGVRAQSFLSLVSAAIRTPGGSMFPPRLLAISLTVVILLVAGAMYWWWSQRGRNVESGQLVAIVTLTPGTLRSGGSTQRVEITPDVGSIQIELRLGSVDFPNYQAELLNEGATIRVVEGLRPTTKNGQHSVVLTMSPLASGDYQVKLSGVADSGRLEALNTYSFRVIRSGISLIVPKEIVFEIFRPIES